MPKAPPLPAETKSNAAVPVAIKGKLRRRFYEAVVFLSALRTTWGANRRSVSQDVLPSLNSFETNFKIYVNTLSAFCDIKQGGDSVTAFAVLDLQGQIQYRFACNKINTNGLEKVKAFVTGLLTTLRENESGDGLEQTLFEKVLWHCRKRVCSYLKSFNDACQGCILANPVGTRLQQLMEFRIAALGVGTRGDDARTFAGNCRQLVDLIEACHRQPDGSALAERPSHGGMNESSSCWSELRHYAGRLKSYAVGVRALMATAKACPRLVEQGFEIKFVQSSSPDKTNPIQAQDVTAYEILKRMCPTPAKALSYNAMVEETRVDLNKNIQAIVAKETFRPIVHAELLILQSIVQDRLVQSSNFFGSWKYIGASKPTCRLCHYYFQCHPERFEVRSTHMNLYINWKPPDVFGRDGEDGIKAREDMMNAMVSPIRADGLRTLEDRVPVGREHDSSTDMTFPAAFSSLPDHFGSQPETGTFFAESGATVGQ